MSNNVLEVKNLSAGIEEREILHDVNFTIKKGEVHVLMGPNGAGKSTIGNVIMGNPRYQVTGGNIIFNGEDVTEYSADKRAKAGIFLSFQEPLEVPGLPLDGFIKNALEQKTGERVRMWDFKKELKKAMDVLSMNESYGKRNLNVGFSGGEKKKAEILQLLMLKPDLAILDETDSGLDVDAVRIVSKGIEEYMRETNGSLLIITHSTRILDNLNVDYTHVCVNGHIIETGDGSLVEKINEGGYESFLEERK